MLLSRVAERIYWAARHLERAEDTARLVRAHGELAADLPVTIPAHWEPLISVVGSDAHFAEMVNGQQQQQQETLSRPQSQSQSHSRSHSSSRSTSRSRSQSPSESQSPSPSPSTFRELAVARFLIADCDNPSSIASSVSSARENLRTTRDIIPRESWHTLNDLYLYVSSAADRSIERLTRERFLGRVIADSRRLDGVLATAMTHDEAYVMWRLGRAIERADMTTRVLGVRAAAVMLFLDGHEVAPIGLHDELQWMGVLRSVSGLQMYQRAVRGPIEGWRVVEFLLDNDRFPRAVRALLREIRLALAELPGPTTCLDTLDHVVAVLRRSTAASTDGAALDDAMDAVQVAIGELNQQITVRYLRGGA